MGIDPTHVKARLRRCKARHKLGELSSASTDAEELLLSAKEDAALGKTLAPLVAAIKHSVANPTPIQLAVPSSAYRTVQSALDAANRSEMGAVVTVAPGKYVENLTLRGAKEGSLALVAADKADGGRATENVKLKKVKVTGRDCRLRGLLVEKGAYVDHGAEATFAGCVLRAPVGEAALTNHGDLVVDDCAVEKAEDGILSYAGTLHVRNTDVRDIVRDGVMAKSPMILENSRLETVGRMPLNIDTPTNLERRGENRIEPSEWQQAQSALLT